VVICAVLFMRTLKKIARYAGYLYRIQTSQVKYFAKAR
jgi:hypothetical protein